MKHRALGFYNPAAQSIAQMIIDVPLYAVQTLIFSSIIYFMMGLNPGAKYFVRVATPALGPITRLTSTLASLSVYVLVHHLHDVHDRCGHVQDDR